MRLERLNFCKLQEEYTRQTKYDLQIDQIRHDYPEIPPEDNVTPRVVMDLLKFKKKLDKRLRATGELHVRKAYSSKEDASANLWYDTDGITCNVVPLFRKRYVRGTAHKQFSAIIPDKYTVCAQIPHPYTDGDEIYAMADDEMTYWKILIWREASNKVTLLGRTKNFHNLSRLKAVLESYENTVSRDTCTDHT